MGFKLLIICNVPPPYHGTTIMNSFLLTYFKRNGFKYIHIPVEGSKSHFELGKVTLEKLKNSFRILINIISLRKKYKISYLVMSVNGFAFYRHCLFILLLLAMKKVVVLHLRAAGFSKKKGFQKWILTFIFEKSYLIQHTSLNRCDIEMYSYKKVYDIPNGWPDVYNKYIEFKTPIKNKIDVIFLSNLFETKGIFILLDAIKKLNGDGLNCMFHFIGNWKSIETKERFNSFIFKNSLNSLIGEVGPKYNEEKYKFLINMDILVFPTYYEHETWGNVNLEAMMFEIPVIASNLAGIPEMIKHGVNGFLIEPMSSDDLYRKLLKFIKSKHLRKDFGLSGRRLFLEKFTLDKFEINLNKVLREIENNS